MKRIITFFVILILIFSLCACQMNGGRVLKETMDIPADGFVEASVFKQLKEELGVVTFQGESNGNAYNWKIFGEEIETPKQLNLSCEITEKDEELLVTFASQENFGFSPMLSVALQQPWKAKAVAVYNEDGIQISEGTITGEDPVLVNVTVPAVNGTITVIPVKAQNKPVTGNSISDGTQTEQDQYLTDPVPEGRPMPVEPGEVTGTDIFICTISIECSTILNNLDDLDPAKLDQIPSNGVILPPVTVTFTEGESVFDVLQRVCQENEIHMESTWTPMYNSAYVEGIHNLYEFDCGSLSGWMYKVNDWYPNYGCSRYQLQDGDVVEWRFTCDLGHDVGDNSMTG